jgi:hypothetical protein
MSVVGLDGSAMTTAIYRKKRAIASPFLAKKFYRFE